MLSESSIWSLWTPFWDPLSTFGCPLGLLWVPFGRPLGVIWVPCAPLKILKILETPSAQLFGRFGVAKGSYRWPPRDPIGAPNASRWDPDVVWMIPNAVFGSFFGHIRQKNTDFWNIKIPSSFSLSNDMAKGPDERKLSFWWPFCRPEAASWSSFLELP